ncbi:alpha/beta hydrolase [Solwaraspora sp. WMMD406]|uniref:alpha/beta fold hydrolase n=1 Tax=Solwaraspora sp. WMMD406 TaxID=3016095 RepID=UPI002417AFFA|nr:alpha/beta hydrolase [Solwaraspora sp. WMMD406]MDG4764945.1 alpha/beta hydrolase [Solwaraspora sp. WMMD406]
MSSIYRSEAGARLLAEDYRGVLASWPVEHERRHVPTPEGDTFVITCGPPDAPAVVLLHGAGSNSALWTGRAGDLTQRFRVIAIDIIGEPGFSAPSRPPLGSDRYAAWLDAVLDVLGQRRVAIVGMSLGGWLALDYATRRPDRVDGLVLYCPGGIGRQRRWSVLGALLLTVFGDAGRRRSLSMILGPALAAMAPSEAKQVIDRMLLVSTNFRYRMGGLPVFDDETLRRLTIPMQVHLGRLDVMIDSVETHRRLDATVPHASVTMLPDIGHLVPPQAEAELAFLNALC